MRTGHPLPSRSDRSNTSRPDAARTHDCALGRHPQRSALPRSRPSVRTPSARHRAACGADSTPPLTSCWCCCDSSDECTGWNTGFLSCARLAALTPTRRRRAPGPRHAAPAVDLPDVPPWGAVPKVHSPTPAAVTEDPASRFTSRPWARIRRSSAPEGNPRDLPALPAFAAGWQNRHARRGAYIGAFRRLADRPLRLQRRFAADQFRRRQVRARGGGPARRAVDHAPRQRLRAGTWWPRPRRQLLARHRRQGLSGRRGQADSRRHHPDSQHALQPEGPARARPWHPRRAEVRDRADPAGGDHRRQQQQRHRHPAGRRQLRAGRGSPSSSPRTATCSPSRRA